MPMINDERGGRHALRNWLWIYDHSNLRGQVTSSSFQTSAFFMRWQKPRKTKVIYDEGGYAPHVGSWSLFCSTATEAGSKLGQNLFCAGVAQRAYTQSHDRTPILGRLMNDSHVYKVPVLRFEDGLNAKSKIGSSIDLTILQLVGWRSWRTSRGIEKGHTQNYQAWTKSHTILNIDSSGCFDMKNAGWNGDDLARRKIRKLSLAANGSVLRLARCRASERIAKYNE